MQGKKFEQIDTLRFISIFFVLLAHWESSLHDISHLIDTGARGVELFFVISGFLITLGLIRSGDQEHKPGISLYKFYIRRFLRIFPAYYLTLIILWCVNYCGIRDVIWWYIGYFSNFYSIKTQSWGPVGHLWSLAVEEQFYLVWPMLILFVPRKWLLYIITAAFFVSLGTKVYWHNINYRWWASYMHPLGCLDILSLGALLAYLFHFHNSRLKTALYNPWITILIISQLVVCYNLQSTPFQVINFVGLRASYGLFCSWLIGRCAFGVGGIIGAVLNFGPFRYIGRISYSIYLFHAVILGVVFNFKTFATPDLQFVILGTLIICLSTISWFFYEKPILKLKARFE